jgi:hypothetical protein
MSGSDFTRILAAAELMEDCHKQLALSFLQGYVSITGQSGHIVPEIKKFS